MELQDVEVVTEGLAFPEGPVVMPDGSVVVMEINAGRVTRVDPADGTQTLVADTGGGPNGAALGPDGALYVCNNGGLGQGPSLQGCVQRVDLDSGAVTLLYDRCGDAMLAAPNDIVFDTSGNFYFTDLAGGVVYYASPDGASIRVAIDGGVPHCNGVGLSPDGDVLYVALTMGRQVVRRRVAAPGELVQSPGYSITARVGEGSADRWTLVAGLPDSYELDSLAVDSAGIVCVATLMESCITTFTPEGVTEHHYLPAELFDQCVTNICFGGPDLTTAYITGALTGRLLRATWPRPGLPLAFP